MSIRRRRRKYRVPQERSQANENFREMQLLLKDFIELAEKAHAVYPDRVQVLLQDLRDTLYTIEPFKGDAAWWPQDFKHRKAAVNRIVQWVHQHQPPRAFAALMLCRTRLRALAPKETAE